MHSFGICEVAIQTAILFSPSGRSLGLVPWTRPPLGSGRRGEVDSHRAAASRLCPCLGVCPTWPSDHFVCSAHAFDPHASLTISRTRRGSLASVRTHQPLARGTGSITPASDASCRGRHFSHFRDEN